MTAHIDRMKTEYNELKVKVDALSAFIYSNEIFQSLNDDEKVRMCKQLTHMEGYLSVLLDRLTAATWSN